MCYLHDLYLKTVKEGGVGLSTMLLDISRKFQERIDDIDDNLVDLEDVVSAVEKRPEKYGISNEEILKRRAFVDQVRNDLKEMQKDLDNPAIGPSRNEEKVCV